MSLATLPRCRLRRCRCGANKVLPLLLAIRLSCTAVATSTDAATFEAKPQAEAEAEATARRRPFLERRLPAETASADVDVPAAVSPTAAGASAVGLPSGARLKVFASGGFLQADPVGVNEVIRLSGRPTPRVLYIGAANYDMPGFFNWETRLYVDAGCNVSKLAVAAESPAESRAKAAMDAAEVIMIGVGNTLFARDRLAKTGVDRLIRDRVASGAAVLAGGSAGAILAFDGGHSDSMRPASFKDPPAGLTTAQKNDWPYIRVSGLGVLPGFLCPHFESITDNFQSQPRAEDFASMLAANHSGETGIGIDSWAALVVEGDGYRVLSKGNQHGSVAADGSFTTSMEHGRPGAWRVIVRPHGGVERTRLPGGGSVHDIMQAAKGDIVEDQRLPLARSANPDDGVPPRSGWR